MRTIFAFALACALAACGDSEGESPGGKPGPGPNKPDAADADVSEPDPEPDVGGPGKPDIGPNKPDKPKPDPDLPPEPDEGPDEGPTDGGPPGDVPTTCGELNSECDDGIECTKDLCIDGECVYTPYDEVCDDGLRCNGDEVCDPLEGCVAGTTLPCDDEEACTTDLCEEVEAVFEDAETVGPNGYSCSYTTNDALCDDGDECTGDELCLGGTGCVSLFPLFCADGVLCTVDTCVTGQGCVHTPDDAPCDDGKACNGTEICTASGCAVGDSIPCDDGVACTVDACDDATGGCVSIPVNAKCTDGMPCNGIEICDPIAGCKPGSPLQCKDDGPCVIKSTCIDSQGGCVSQKIPCDDGKECTADSCVLGSCVFVSLCTDGNPCSEGICQDDGSCTFTPKESGPCEDGNECTLDDFCQAGTCYPGSLNGLFFHWAFDEDEKAKDASGQGRKGTLFGTPSWVAGPTGGGAIRLINSGLGGLEHEGATIAGLPVGPFSISAVVKPTEDGTIGTIFQRNPTTSIYPSMQITESFVVLGSQTVASWSLPADYWSHIALTWNGKTAAAYLDGELVGSVDMNKTPLGDELTMGVEVGPTFQGSIDDVRFFNDGLVAAQITKLFEGEEAGCVRCYEDNACDDGNLCTVDACDAEAGCIHLPELLVCDDGDECTGPDVCLGTGCEGPPVNCDDGNPCTVDSCEPGVGCVSTPAEEGASCFLGGPCVEAFCDAGGTCVQAQILGSLAIDAGEAWEDLSGLGNGVNAPFNFSTPDAGYDLDPVAEIVAPPPAQTFLGELNSTSSSDGSLTLAFFVGPPANGGAGLSVETETGTSLLDVVVTATTVTVSGVGLTLPMSAAAPSDFFQVIVEVGPDGAVLTLDGVEADSSNYSVVEPTGVEGTLSGALPAGTQIDEIIFFGGAWAWDEPPYNAKQNCGATDCEAKCDDNNECTEDVCVGGECTNTPLNGGACTGNSPCTENTCNAGVCESIGMGRDIWAPLNEGSGSPSDVVAPEQTLELTGAATWGEGYLGTAGLSFAGSGSLEAEPTNSSTNAFATTFWMNWSGASATFFQRDATAGAGVSLRVDSQGVVTLSCFGVSHASAPGKMAPSLWSFVGLSLRNGVAYVNVNGETVLSKDCTSDNDFGPVAEYGVQLTGQIDDVAIYRVGLTEPQLTAASRGDELICNDGDLCTVDACDPVEGCTFPTLVCTHIDSCKVAVCDPEVGACRTSPLCDYDPSTPCVESQCQPSLTCDDLGWPVFDEEAGTCAAIAPGNDEVCGYGTLYAPGAAAGCSSRGARLCTVDEVLGGALTIEGCSVGANDKWWTTEFCEGDQYKAVTIEGTVTCHEPGSAQLGYRVCCAGPVPGPVGYCEAAANVADGTYCDDGDLCTTGEQCDAGVCEGGAAIDASDCDDGNGCTIDSCDPDTGGCTHEPVDCFDGDRCAIHSCDIGTGECSKTPVPADYCEDDNVCTTEECVNTSGCVYTPIDCSDGKSCTHDECDPEAGCYNPPIDPEEEDEICGADTACSNNYCNASDQCVSELIGCDDDNPCTVDICTGEGQCDHFPLNCADTLTCTTDTCVDGVCQHVATSGCIEPPADPPPSGCVTLVDNALYIDCFEDSSYVMQGVWTETAPGTWVATSGTMELTTLLGPIPIQIGTYIMVQDSPFDLSGDLSVIPFPGLDWLSGGQFTNESGAGVSIGLAAGNALSLEGAELNPNRGYFYFQLGGALSMTLGSMTMDPADTEVNLVQAILDPDDPLIYLSLNSGGLETGSMVGAAHFGMSAGGNLSLESLHPLWTGELECDDSDPPACQPTGEETKVCEGHYVGGASISLTEVTGIPVSITGELCIDADYTGTGYVASQTLPSILGQGLLNPQSASTGGGFVETYPRVLANGTVNADVPILSTLWALQLGSGSMMVDVGPGGGIWMHGQTDNPLAGIPVLEDLVPPTQTYEMDAYYAGIDDFGARWTSGIDMGLFNSAEMTFLLTNEGLAASGEMDFGQIQGEVSGMIGFDGSVSMTGTMNLNHLGMVKSDFSITVSGSITEPVVTGTAEVKVIATTMTLSVTIDTSGFFLSGKLSREGAIFDSLPDLGKACDDMNDWLTNLWNSFTDWASDYAGDIGLGSVSSWFEDKIEGMCDSISTVQSQLEDWVDSLDTGLKYTLRIETKNLTSMTASIDGTLKIKGQKFTFDKSLSWNTNGTHEVKFPWPAGKQSLKLF